MPTPFEEIQVSKGMKPIRRKAYTPPIHNATVVSFDDKSTRDVVALRADGMQVSVDQEGDQPPFISMLQHFGDGALYTGYAEESDVESLIDGLKDALNTLREMRKEYDNKGKKTK